MHDTPPPGGWGANLPPSPPPPRGESPRDVFRRLGADVVSGVRASTPTLRRGATRFGDWLAGIGWGKFFLLSILMLILGGFLSSVLFDRGPTVIVERDGPTEPVDVRVTVTPEGIRVSPPDTPPRPRRAPSPEPPEAAPAPPAPPAPPVPDEAKPAKPADREEARAGIRVDERGVRIFADRDGKQVAIIIDDKGVRFQDASTAEAAGVRVERDEKSIVIPREVAEDPARVAEAVEAVRGAVQEILSEQVSRQVARRARVYSEQSEDWLMSFVLMLIVASIIIKLILGSKKKAESRAQVASATAAEEGLKRQLAEAQLKMMQAQVEPHFLFNTLASVDYLIETDPAKASKMQKNLIQYLRAALPQMREGSTTLGKEVSLCRAYLEILKVRMEDRLQFAINVPQGLASAQFPPMMLQSLVENAIKHGLEPKADGGSLTISADFANGNLRVTVADTGLGFGGASAPGTGVGLANVRERLAALYGGRAHLTIAANTPSGTIATIEVPYTLDASTDTRQQPPEPPLAAQPA